MSLTLLTRVLVAVIAILGLLAPAARAQAPERIHYQGKLVDGAGLFNGTASFVFRLWDQAEGGANVYAETQAVVVVDGLYSADIGASNSVPGSLAIALQATNLWLEVSVDGTALRPREPLASAPYALLAAGTGPGGVTSAMLADGAVGGAQLASNLVVRGTVTAAGFSGNGAMPWQTVNGTYQQAAAGTAYLGTDAGTTVVALPPAPTVGDVVRVSAAGTGRWAVVAAPGQSIQGVATGSMVWIARESNRMWQAVASSADGSRRVAVVNGGGLIYVSEDAGSTWTPRGVGRLWASVACSSDGQRMVAAAYNDDLYTSTDGGTNWVARGAGALKWKAVASSADGMRLLAGAEYTKLFTSVDGGTNWTPRGSVQPNWTQVASSADGMRLAAAGYSAGVYTSTDGGTNWTFRLGGGGTYWTGIASSTNGLKLLASSNGGNLWTSTNGGTNWTQRESSRAWNTVASSADGVRLLAADLGGQVYRSVDSGATWSPSGPSGTWPGIASSWDGSLLTAALMGDRIYLAFDGALAGSAGAAAELQYAGGGVWQPLAATRVADGSVSSNSLVAGSVGAAHLGDSAVTAAKLATAAVTSRSLATGSVEVIHLAASSVGTNQLRIAETDARYVLKAGDKMNGPLDLSNNRVTSLGPPSASTDAATKGYVDAAISGLVKQLAESFTVAPGRSVTAGDVVHFLNGGIQKGRWVATTNLGVAAQEVAAVALASNVFVAVYTYATNDTVYGFARIGTVAGDSIAWGPSATFDYAYGMGSPAVAALSDTTFAVAYSATYRQWVYSMWSGWHWEYQYYGFGVVGQRSGDTCSFGSRAQFNNQTASIALAAPNASGVVVAYRDEDPWDGNVGGANYGVVSGTSLSWGPTALFMSNATHSIAIEAMSATDLVVAFGVEPSIEGRLNYGTIAPPILTWGTSMAFRNKPTSHCALRKLSAANLLLAFADGANGGFGTAMVGTLSGPLVSTWTPESVFSYATCSGLSAARVSDTAFRIGYASGGEARVIPGSLLGSALHWGTPARLAAGACTLAGGLDSGVAAVATSGPVALAGDAPPVGIALRTRAAGQTCLVALDGVVENTVVGLLPGQRYYTDAAGNLGTNVDTYVGLGIATNKLLLRTDWNW